MLPAGYDTGRPRRTRILQPHKSRAYSTGAPQRAGRSARSMHASHAPGNAAPTSSMRRSAGTPAAREPPTRAKGSLEEDPNTPIDTAQVNATRSSTPPTATAALACCTAMAAVQENGATCRAATDSNTPGSGATSTIVRFSSWRREARHAASPVCRAGSRSGEPEASCGRKAPLPTASRHRD